MQKLGLLNSTKILFPLNNDLGFNTYSFIQNGEHLTFKFCKSLENSYVHNLNEVFLSRFAKKVGMKCQHATFASCFKTRGVMLTDYLKREDKEISFYDIINEKYITELKDAIGENFFDDVVFPYLEKEKKKSKKKIEDSFIVEKNDTFSQVNYLIDCNLKVRQTSPEILEHIHKNYVKILNVFLKVEKPSSDALIYNEVVQFAEEQNLVLDDDFKLNLCQLILFDATVNQDGRTMKNIKFKISGNRLSLCPISENANCVVGKSMKYFKCKNQIIKTDFFYKELTQNEKLQKNFRIIKNTISNKDDFILNFNMEHREGLQRNMPKNIEGKYIFLNEYLESWFSIMQFNISLIEKEWNSYKTRSTDGEKELI